MVQQAANNLQTMHGFLFPWALAWLFPTWVLVSSAICEICKYCQSTIQGHAKTQENLTVQPRVGRCIRSWCCLCARCVCVLPQTGRTPASRVFIKEAGQVGQRCAVCPPKVWLRHNWVYKDCQNGQQSFNLPWLSCKNSHVHHVCIRMGGRGYSRQQRSIGPFSTLVELISNVVAQRRAVGQSCDLQQNACS